MTSSGIDRTNPTATRGGMFASSRDRAVRRSRPVRNISSGETGYKVFLHGEAVAWGMVAAAMIAVGMHRTSLPSAQRIISLVLAYAPLPKVEVRPKSIFRRLASDKKTLDGQVHFVLPHDIGHVDIVTDVPERAVLQVVEELRSLSQA